MKRGKHGRKGMTSSGGGGHEEEEMKIEMMTRSFLVRVAVLG